MGDEDLRGSLAFQRDKKQKQISNDQTFLDSRDAFSGDPFRLRISFLFRFCSVRSVHCADLKSLRFSAPPAFEAPHVQDSAWRGVKRRRNRCSRSSRLRPITAVRFESPSFNHFCLAYLCSYLLLGSATVSTESGTCLQLKVAESPKVPKGQQFSESLRSRDWTLEAVAVTRLEVGRMQNIPRGNIAQAPEWVFDGGKSTALSLVRIPYLIWHITKRTKRSKMEIS